MLAILRLLCAVKRFQKQGRADEKQKRNGDLRDNEKIAQVPSLNTTAGGDGAFAQTLRQIPAGRLPCRGESENNPAQKGEQNCAKQNPEIRLRIERERNRRGRQKRKQNVAQPVSEHDPTEAPDQRQ